MRPTDAAAASGLLPDLGYAATSVQLQSRLAALRDWPDQEVFVAELEGSVVGLCQVQGVRLLVSDGYAEIQALVVAAACQGRGFGKALVAQACDWAFARGYERVRLRSGTHRLQAHAFYEARGFENARASFAFELRKP
jgi:GNAT superfamily N-acetyltransferase